MLAVMPSRAAGDDTFRGRDAVGRRIHDALLLAGGEGEAIRFVGASLSP